MHRTEERLGGWSRVEERQEKAGAEVLREARAGYVSFYRSS